MNMNATIPTGSFAMKLKTLSRHSARLACLAVFAVAAFASSTMPASAVTTAQLAGSWQATLLIDGGCGIGTKLVKFTLNSTGVASNAVGHYHTSECGDAEETGTFAITSLQTDGYGTAQLTFGGTVFNFVIQVSPNAQVFNLVDIADSGNYEEGTAIVK